MKELIISWSSGLPNELAIFLISLIPITELRLSIPLAIGVYGMDPFSAWLWSVLGMFFATVVVVFLLDPIAIFLSKHIAVCERFFRWLFEHTRRQNDRKMEKYGIWAIFVLSATPIPFVGGLTGALAAFVFGIHWKKSLPLLLTGTMVAGGIVLGVTMYF